jgi:stage III sporulation protein SpoIIIAA
MQVAKTELQHQVMIEAVENHMPQVIIIDEIGTELEVLATGRSPKRCSTCWDDTWEL